VSRAGAVRASGGVAALVLAVATLGAGARPPRAAAASARSALAWPAPRQEVAPRATLLYQNFPNPFPTTTNRTTCVWFDLRAASQVRLDVFTLRGAHVRSLLPSRDMPARLDAGRYGRGPTGASGCDPRLAWDGTGDNGRIAPAGVYLIRLRADGLELVRKALFEGR
jgi:hypothetical protein